MFVGHYAVSFAIKKIEPKTSLFVLFLAVQLVDIIFFPLVLLGVERFDLILNHTESTHFDLYFMPYTHSLVGSIGWAIIVFGIVKYKYKNSKMAILVGLAVLSHWFMDLIVHTPDLPLLGDDSIKVGFGLWNNAIASYSLEALLLSGGLFLYLNSTNRYKKPTSKNNKQYYGMIIFVLIMLIINGANIFGPPFGSSELNVSISALASYFSFAAIAFWLDKDNSSDNSNNL